MQPETVCDNPYENLIKQITFDSATTSLITQANQNNNSCLGE